MKIPGIIANGKNDDIQLKILVPTGQGKRL
jgi:hypothetical protein